MIIGLTGGIGSGKSVVAKLLEVLGCKIYNSDDSAKQIYFNADVKPRVIDLLGNSAYLSDTEIDKDYISKKIFSDKLLLEKLNAIIHPTVKSDFTKFVKQHQHKIIVKETALLFELDIYKDVDVTILVTAPTQLKIERIKQRNNFTDNEIAKRMQAQWTDEQKLPLANYVITNDNTQALIPQVIRVLDDIKNKL